MWERGSLVPPEQFILYLKGISTINYVSAAGFLIFYFCKYFLPLHLCATYLQGRTRKETIKSNICLRKWKTKRLWMIWNGAALNVQRVNNPGGSPEGCGSELLAFLWEFSEAKPAFGEWMCWSCGASQKICVWINTLGRFLAATEPAVFYSAILKLRLGSSGSLTLTHTLAPISPPPPCLSAYRIRALFWESKGLFRYER